MFKKTICLLFVVFLLPSCAKEAIALSTERIEEGQINVEIPYVSGLGEKGESLNEEFRARAQQQIDAFLKRYADFPEFTYTQTVKLTTATDEIISFIVDISSFTGGAHPTQKRIAYNYSLLENRFLTLEDFFPDSDNCYETVTGIMRQLAEDNPDEYGLLWDDPTVTEQNKDDFYICDGDLVFFFPPYTLSYYARGYVEFRISL